MFQFRIPNLLLMMLLAFALRAYASDISTAPAPSPCYVCFDLNEESLKVWYGTECKSLEKKVAEGIAERMTTMFPHWVFQANNDASYPRIKVWLESTTAWTFHSTIEPASHESGQQIGDGVLFSPEEVNQMGGFPAPADLPNEIARRFNQNVLNRYKTQIEAALRIVPLVRAVVPLRELLLSKTEPVSSVLPLRWERYSDLAAAKFRIVCSWPNHRGIELYSHGTKQCANFPVSTASFYAIEVEYERWGEKDTLKDHLVDLNDLVVSAIYLQEYNWEPPFDCDQPSTAIAQ